VTRSHRAGRAAASGGYDAQHVMLVGSAGGHLAQLLALRPWWRERQRTWVTFDTVDASSRLAGEDIVYAYHPTTRNVLNLARNFVLAFRQLITKRPDLIVSTGAGVAVPFVVLARILGLPTVYIEVVDRVNTRTLTGRICYRLVDKFLVQWTEQLELYPNASVIGVLI
jgi:UDP-N-acetylglucosamine:LPS N-acetylglucosamine transferase